MEKSNAVAALAELAQDNRLDVYRLLVQAGSDGLPADRVAAALKLAPNTLTFHFDRLRGAGLVSVRRDSRSMIYAARYDTMNALLGYLLIRLHHGRLGREQRRIESDRIRQVFAPDMNVHALHEICSLYRRQRLVPDALHHGFKIFPDLVRETKSFDDGSRSKQRKDTNIVEGQLTVDRQGALDQTTEFLHYGDGTGERQACIAHAKVCCEPQTASQSVPQTVAGCCTT